MSMGLVSGIMTRATVLQIVAENVDALDEAELEERFYGKRAAKRASRTAARSGRDAHRAEARQRDAAGAGR